MIVLGIDPGPTTCGVVLYDAAARQVTGAWSAVSVEDVLLLVLQRTDTVVAIERVQAQGQSGASLLETSEVVGRLQQRALDFGRAVRLMYRREVLRALDVTGTGNRDALVRQRIIEAHGGAAAIGTKRAPGPLYGVSGHAWQALGVAFAAAETMGKEAT